MGRLILLAAMLTASCGRETAGEETAPKPAPPPVFAQVSQDRVEHGHRLADILGCTGCHAADLTGEDWSEPGYGVLWTSNLSRAVPRYDDAALVQAITAGRNRDGREMIGMPSFLFTQLSADNLAALIVFLRSRPAAGVDHPQPTIGPLAQREMAEGTIHTSVGEVELQGNAWPPDTGASHQRGRAIVRATCAECHGMDLAGNTGPVPPRPPLSVAAAYDRASFHRLMRTGKAMGERELTLMSAVSRGRYNRFTDEEIDAVYDYLSAAARAQAPR